MSIHNDGPNCFGCNRKLLDGHPLLGVWWPAIKKQFTDCHISWTFRNEADQQLALQTGKSNDAWPTSPHNKMREDPNNPGKMIPYSYAMDLFRQIDGVGSWHHDYYIDIDKHLKSLGCCLQWGGDWRDHTGRPLRLNDLDHFQVPLDMP